MDTRFERSFGRDLANIRDKNLLRRINEIIGEIEAAGDLSSITKLKKLRGYDTFIESDWEIIGSELRFLEIL